MLYCYINFHLDPTIDPSESGGGGTPALLDLLTGVELSSGDAAEKTWFRNGCEHMDETRGTCLILGTLIITYVDFLSHRGTPSHHPFVDGIFPYKPSFLLVPPF